MLASNQCLIDSLDFLPFGEQILGDSATSHKFAAKERDSESGLDDFGARYYSSNLGRFVSADWSAIPVPVPYANFTNPQTLNLYTIVNDNPETFADLDGHENSDGGPNCQSDGNCGGPKQDQTKQQQLQAQETSQQPSASQIGAAAGAVTGAVVGAVVGAVGGAAVGTVAEPGGGTVVVGIVGGAQGAQTGAETGAAMGAAAGALAPVVYSKSKEAAARVGRFIDTAIDHLGKLNGPDQNPNPRKGWRDTVRKSADNISKQADKIANKNLANAARFTADLLRGLVD